jgi:hypothetical protein
MITLTVDGQQVDCYSGDIVNDTLNTSVGVVPFEWSTGFELQQAIDAIAAYLAGTPVPVTSTGLGWVIDLPSATHPQVEVKEIDFVTDLINFCWLGTQYPGDCAVAFEFTIATTPAEVAAACVALVS